MTKNLSLRNERPSLQHSCLYWMYHHSLWSSSLNWSCPQKDEISYLGPHTRARRPQISRDPRIPNVIIWAGMSDGLSVPLQSRFTVSKNIEAPGGTWVIFCCCCWLLWVEDRRAMQLLAPVVTASCSHLQTCKQCFSKKKWFLVNFLA